MKKTLIALAALAATGAFAQSTANITGTVGFAHQQHRPTGSGFTNTDISVTVAASEDLGGGLRASGAVTFDSTNGTFGGTNPLLVRNKSIALSGGFGTVSLANTRSGDLLTRGMVAPTALPEGMYDTSGIIARAPVDVVTYTLPAMSGFAPYFQYVESALATPVAPVAPATIPTVGATGADGSADKGNRTYVVGGNYSAGPLAVGVAYKVGKNKAYTGRVDSANANIMGYTNNLEAFASYNLGVAIIGVGFDQKNASDSDAATSFGVAVPMGALTLGANYASRKVGTAKNQVTELVAKYDLSRRTFVHLSWGDQTNDAVVGNASRDGKQHRLGLVHNF